jgi:hypothetical protein
MRRARARGGLDQLHDKVSSCHHEKLLMREQCALVRVSPAERITQHAVDASPAAAALLTCRRPIS